MGRRRGEWNGGTHLGLAGGRHFWRSSDGAGGGAAAGGSPINGAGRLLPEASGATGGAEMGYLGAGAWRAAISGQQAPLSGPDAVAGRGVRAGGGAVAGVRSWRQNQPPPRKLTVYRSTRSIYLYCSSIDSWAQLKPAATLLLWSTGTGTATRTYT